MSDQFTLIPKVGLIVRDPGDGEALPEGGAAKPKSSYWRKRLRDGDVSEGKALPTAGTKSKDKEAKT